MTHSPLFSSQKLHSSFMQGKRVKQSFKDDNFDMQYMSQFENISILE
jgi:hypothetical protein